MFLLLEPAQYISAKELSSTRYFRTFNIPIFPWHMTYIDILKGSSLFDEELKTFFKYDIDLLEYYHVNLRTHHQ